MLREEHRALGWTRGLDARSVIMVMLAALLLVIVAYPASLLILKSLPWSNYLDVAADPLARRALLNTLYVGIAAATLATMLGVVAAFLLTRTDIALKGMLRALIFLTLITPAYIGAIAWIQLLGRSGYITNLLTETLGLNATPVDLYTLEGLIAITTIHLYPLIFLSTSNVLSHTDPSLEEVAAASGAGRLRVLLTVTLPLALPGILSGVVLVFVQAIACFGIASAIAMPTGNYVLTTRIYTALGHYDVRMACALSVVLVLLASGSLVVYNLLLRRKRHTVTTSTSRKPDLIGLGWWKWPIAVAVLLFLVTTILLPLVTIFLSSLLKAWGLLPVPGNLSLGNYVRVLSHDLTASALWNSLTFAITGATAAVLIGLIVSYISIRTRMAGRIVLDYLATAPLVIPGPVLSTAMILAWMNPPFRLYNTPWIILVAYIVAFTPYAVRNVSGAIKGMDPSMEEMGWMSGASWTRTMRDITGPLIRSGIWTGWIIVFLMAFREIPLSTMLYTQSTETVGVLLFYLKSEAGGMEVISALAVIVMVITIIGQLLVEKLGIRRMEV